MNVEVKLFAAAREACDCSLLQIEIADIATVQTVFDLLNGTYPKLKNIENLLCAVNNQYASFDAHINPGDIVAFFTPVSGG